MILIFLKKLDENSYLICFENGVYDLESDNFRDGHPDDYISLCTNYKYVELDENNVIYKNINDFLKKIQPVEEIRRYLMMLLSTCLAGSINEDSFYVFVGSGSNGKTTLIELMKHALGDLFKRMDIRFLTGQTSSSSLILSELADKKGVRLCYFNDLKMNTKLNANFMKILTDSGILSNLTVKSLFKQPAYFKPQLKPFFSCNYDDLSIIKSNDDGVLQKLKVIPFQSKFIEKNYAETEMIKNGLIENQFWADDCLSEKLSEWKQVFMGMLIQCHKDYKKQGLIYPKVVVEEIITYHTKCSV